MYKSITGIEGSDDRREVRDGVSDITACKAVLQRYFKVSVAPKPLSLLHAAANCGKTDGGFW